MFVISKTSTTSSSNVGGKSNSLVKSRVKLVSQIYIVNGNFVDPMVKQHKLEQKANLLLLEVEQGLLEFYNEFKKDDVDDLNRLNEKWLVYNAMLN
jgi:hypothetical protein